jgi:hypothetical protein
VVSLALLEIIAFCTWIHPNLVLQIHNEIAFLNWVVIGMFHLLL